MSEPNPQLGMNHFDFTVTTDVVIDHDQMLTDGACAKAIATRDVGIQKISDFNANEVTGFHWATSSCCVSTFSRWRMSIVATSLLKKTLYWVLFRQWL
jgi:hypothetical protein